ncbi:RNA-dependent RNA polymerase 6-like [Coffea arabica]|uniref:RNA-dependent RNA polymerase n=1 Tax=Coffea arabica TaxID=13443 RepID=A0ABM4VDU9_COFAR
MMGSEGSEKNLVVTQISVGGFDDYVTAKMLLDYFEDNIGTVWRCRLKTSSTPLESYPANDIDSNHVQRKSDYERVKPHAFVHFASSEAVQCALDAAGRGELTLGMKPLKVSLGPENPYRMNERRRTITPFRLSNVSPEIGVLVSHDEFVVGWRGPPKAFDFLVDPFNGSCRLLFTRDTDFSFKGESKYAVIKCNFKVEFLVREINAIRQYRYSSGFVILLQLASSPRIHYRTADDDIEESVPFDLLDDDDPWIRTTDFTPSGAIGRCNIYRISIPPRNGGTLERALVYLKQSRVHVQYMSPANKLLIKDEPDFGMASSDPFFCIQYKQGITFKVLFLVNAVMHKGIINQHQMSDRFFDLLRLESEEVNLAALKHIYSYKWPLFDASKKLESVQQWLHKNPKLTERPKQLDDIVEVRRVIITPSKAYCLPPEVELSNRVLRHYRDIADRFLRVTFMDEGMQTLNRNLLSYYAAPIVWDVTSNSNLQRTSMFKRVKDILSNGFYICGRKYSFLAFSANQLRDRSAWFFAENKNVRVANIISWMGRFADRNVAKCAARMGQCFSSTYATVEVPPSQVDSELPDIKRNTFVFSDGIGMMTSDLAAEVAERLRLTENPPCAYQIRYAGCKGVVACWPSKTNGYRLYLRESMRKFDSTHTILEICSWTRFQPGFLNRQIITLLSALGVQDNIFWRMQESMILRLNLMLEDTDVAFDVVTASCAEQGNTAAIMLSAGFNPETEPHLRGMLTSVRAAQLGDLRERARIFVASGRWLMGCLDELAVLEQGQCFIQVSGPCLENCFFRHGSKFSETKKNLQVIKGLVVIAKNPCLHPGDVRILEAVDAPELRHLTDCLVFPQKGDRPHANEASGSDLDGDLYFVTWDGNLIPPSKRSWMPMDYASAEARKLPREVNHPDIIDFFSKNMVTESLGAICNAHVVHADLSEYGALDEKCIKLAELAATAVDFPKTGKIVNMPSEYKPKMYPDFMGKEDFQSYKSKKILGKLYRQVKDACDEGEAATSDLTFPSNKIPYDTDLEIPGSEVFIEHAWNTKCSYDGQLNGLLGQYRVNREEEVVTGHIWSMPKYSSKKLGDLKERLKHAYNNLRKEFRRVFEQMEPDFELLTDDEKNVMYEKKASAWYQVTYHPTWLQRSLELQLPDGVEETVMLSFAWIAVDYLAQIKIRCRGSWNLDSSKPIDSLGRYLSDKI